MSRLIIKNLPSYVDPTRLKEHFTQQKGPGGTITDVKVALKQDGTSRRFGFIGFKTDAEAAKAKEWFDNTFIDSTRVRVDIIDVSSYRVHIHHLLDDQSIRSPPCRELRMRPLLAQTNAYD